MSGSALATAAVVSVLVLTTAACVPDPRAAPTGASTAPGSVPSPSPALSRDPKPTTAIAATLRLQASTDMPALGRAVRSLVLSGSDTYWIADDRTAPEHSLIIASEPPTAPRVMFSPSRIGAHFQGLHVDSDWIAWLEHVDTRSWRDARIYAAHRGGEPFLVDDMARYGDLVTFPELALDGPDLFWSVPELQADGWRGRLFHRDLVAQTTDVVEDSEGMVFTGPSAASGRLAYEVARFRSTTPMFVRIRSAGQITDIVGPASEPALGGSYLVFKRGNRFESATIESISLTTRATVLFGHGEAPRADDSFAVWFDSNANQGVVGIPSDGCAAFSTANRNGTDGVALVSVAVGGTRLGWSGIRNVAGNVTEFVRTASIEQIACSGP